MAKQENHETKDETEPSTPNTDDNTEGWRGCVYEPEKSLFNFEQPTNQDFSTKENAHFRFSFNSVIHSLNIVRLVLRALAWKQSWAFFPHSTISTQTHTFYIFDEKCPKYDLLATDLHICWQDIAFINGSPLDWINQYTEICDFSPQSRESPRIQINFGKIQQHPSHGR